MGGIAQAIAELRERLANESDGSSSSDESSSSGHTSDGGSSSDSAGSASGDDSTMKDHQQTLMPTAEGTTTQPIPSAADVQGTPVVAIESDGSSSSDSTGLASVDDTTMTDSLQQQ